MKTLGRVLRDQAGATAIEYGLIAALIAVAGLTGMATLGNSLSNTFGTSANTMASVK